MTLKLTKREALAGQTSKGLGELKAQAAKDVTHVERIRGEYTEKFPNQWIAVVDSEVVGPTKTPQELLELLAERGIEPKAATFAYLDPDFQRAMLL